MKSAKELVLYQLSEERLFQDFVCVLENYHDKFYHKKDMRALAYEALHQLLELSACYGFQGNLWHNYLTFLIINHENAYSIACEIRGAAQGSIHIFAIHDFEIFKELFDFDLGKVAEVLDIPVFKEIIDYQGPEGSSKGFNTRIRERICQLSIRLKQAKDVSEFQQGVTEFYKDFGVGKLGLHKAFRMEYADGKANIVPIAGIAHVYLEDLIGYELQKAKLMENTEAFLMGKKANNCLLYGDAGTGKSSSIKGIINHYYDKGLRMIEVYRHQLQGLNALISQLKNRNYKFIIYMDDLSFEESETEYKYLKAVIEGGLEKKPENILIYATSNRRHLVREKFSDKEERQDDLHKNDTVQEKLSLAARFGQQIYFGAPTPAEFQEIVKQLAIRHQIQMPAEELLAHASQWEISHGGMSGRTAQQFMNYLSGKQSNQG